MEDRSQEEAEIKPDGWSNAPSARDLKKDFEAAREAHSDVKTRVQGYLDNLNITGSALLKDIPKGHSRIQPQLIRKQAEWRYAPLSEPFLATDDLFSADPRTWEDKQAAKENSLVLNKQFSIDINKQLFIDEYVRTAVDEGTVIVKLAWEYEDTTEIVSVPDEVEYTPNPEMAQLHQELHAMMEENPTGFESEVPEELRLAHEYSMSTGTPHEATIISYAEEEQVKVLLNRPSLEVCDYRNVIIDPSCKNDLDKAKFIIYSFETSMADLRKEGDRYTNLENINVEGNSPLSDPDHENQNDPNFNFDDKERKRLIAYEYWGFRDIDDSGTLAPIVATWVGDTLIQLGENPFPDRKLPFVVVPLLPLKKSVYGEPDGALLKDNQAIIGAVTRGMIDVMGRSANGQMGSRKDALDTVNRRRFEQGKDYEFNAGVDPRLAFYMHTYPEIPNSAQFMLQQQNVEAESMSGVKAFSTGINSDALGDVATGINGALGAAGMRETNILRRLASGLVRIGRKVISMNQEFLEDEEIIRITNEKYVAIRRDDLGGKFDLHMDISSAEEDNVKAQELAFMLQTMGPNADRGIVNMVLADIARLRKMPALAERIATFEPQPDPVQEQIAQLEIQKLQAEITKLEAETAENYAEAELDRARARKESSEADLKDLDFVEQESGVKQERQKELQGEQAKSNMAYKAFEHELDTERENLSELQKYLGKNN